MYLMPVNKRGRSLKGRLGFIPSTSTNMVPRRIPAVLATARAYGLQLGALPTANVTSTRKFVPALAAARNARAQVRRRRGFAGLGIDLNPAAPIETSYINPGDTLIDPYQPISLPSGQPVGAVQQAYQNALTASVTSPNPLDYTSPNAAIAAGLDPNMVNAAWASGLARFSTQQQAVSAGVPAITVAQLWNASRSASPTSSLTSTIASNLPLIALVGGGVLLLKRAL